jgi:hypothetical protein
MTEDNSKKDIFISHASEDKEDIVTPIIKSLNENNITYWFDKDKIDWGDSISTKINNGLRKSKYGLVILSKVFLEKGWTKAELNFLLNIEISHGLKKVLPLIVGDVEQILDEYPLLRDKKYIVWDDNPNDIIKQLGIILDKTIIIQEPEIHPKLLKHYKIISEEYENEGIFGSTNGLTLKEIYIEPNCKKLEESKESIDIVNKSNHKYTYTYTKTKKLIHQYLFDYFTIQTDKAKNKIVIVLGYPGQGKSSFTKKIIYDQLSKTRVYKEKILLIKLRDIIYDDFFKNPIETILAEIESNPFINIFWKLKRDDLNDTILILDGLDEIVIREKLATSDIDKFLDNFFQLVIYRFYNLKIIITSRNGYIDLKKIYKDNILILELKEFSLEQQRNWLNSYKKFNHTEITEEVLTKIASSSDYEYIAKLVSQPILLYMIAESNINLFNLTSRVKLFNNLFTELINRRYSNQKHGIFKNIEPNDLRVLIQDIAIEIFKSNYEYIHKETLVKLDSVKKFYLKLDEGFGYNESLKNKKLADALKGIMIAFYFKETEISERNSDDFAIEFYHKSLQEYLTAEKIWDEFQNFMDKDKKTILKIINNLFAKKIMTFEIINYIFEMMEDTSDNNKNKLFQKLKVSIGYFLEKDFVYNHEIDEKSVLDKSLNSFYGFWMIYSYLLPRQSYKENSIKFLRKFLPLKINLSIFENRKELILTQYRKRFIKILKCFLTNFDLPLDLSGLDFSGLNLKGIDFSNCNLDGTLFIATDLSYANLNNAIMRNAELKDSDLSYSLINTNFKNSTLNNINFLGANIKYANFHNTKIQKCELDVNQRLNISYIKSDYSESFVDLLEEESTRSKITKILWR